TLLGGETHNVWVYSKVMQDGTRIGSAGAGAPALLCEEAPPTPPTPPTPVQPSGGGVLPETVVSGVAQLRGPSGCVHSAFNARVRGRSIASVSFFVDGKLAKRFTSARTRYVFKVHPRK